MIANILFRQNTWYTFKIWNIFSTDINAVWKKLPVRQGMVSCTVYNDAHTKFSRTPTLYRRAARSKVCANTYTHPPMNGASPQILLSPNERVEGNTLHGKASLPLVPGQTLLHAFYLTPSTVVPYSSFIVVKREMRNQFFIRQLSQHKQMCPFSPCC